LTLSGGIAIVNPKFPIKKGAEESADAEKAAKGYNKNEKNAICFLGCTMGWDKEYLVIQRIKNDIVDLLKNQILPKSFISKLNSHFSITHLEGDENNNLKIPPRLHWMMAYDFGRMVARTKDGAVINLIEQCKKDVFSNSIKGKKIDTYHALQMWHIAARWAELEYRTINLNAKL